MNFAVQKWQKFTTIPSKYAKYFEIMLTMIFQQIFCHRKRAKVITKSIMGQKLLGDFVNVKLQQFQYIWACMCVFACMYMCEQFNKIRFHKENSEKEREFQRKMCSPHQMCLEKVFCSLFGFQLAQYKRNNQNTWAKRRKQKLNYLQAKGSASKIMVRKDLCDACTLDCYAEI